MTNTDPRMNYYYTNVYPYTTTTTMTTIDTTSVVPTTTYTTTIIPNPTYVWTCGQSDYFTPTPLRPSYTDLAENLKPGTAWFELGTVVRLGCDLCFVVNDQPMYFGARTTLVYLGVLEDYESALEQHLFLSERGIVKYVNWVYDLGWRGSIKRAMQEV